MQITEKANNNMQAEQIDGGIRVYEMLRRIVEGTASKTGVDYFRTLVSHIASALQVKLAFVTECTDQAKTRVRTLAFVEDDEVRENVEYDLAGTPCAKVIAGKMCFYPEKLESLFPKEVGMQSYIGVPLLDANGDLMGHLAVMHDQPMQYNAHYTSILKIFAGRAGAELSRKRSEAALRESEERFRSGFENASIGMAMTAADGRFISINKAFCRMLGYSEAELSTKSFQTITFPDDLEESVTNVRKVIAGEIDCFQVEKRYVHKQGHLIWAITTASVVHDLEDKPWYLFAQVQDITERKLAEEQLSRSEERFRTLFQSAPIGISINGMEGQFLQVNETFQKLMGYGEDELRQMNFGRLTLEEDMPESKRLFTELVQGQREDFNVEKRYRTKNGKVIWAYTRCSAVRDDSGHFAYTFAMVEDISERKHAEQALHTALAEVRELKNRLEAENIYLQEEIRTEADFEEIIGRSKAIRGVLQKIRSVAGTDASVLITGETGTGKELIARAVHNNSNRKERPLIKVNCAAMPSGLVESEFFGHEKGAFTGAIHSKQGRFELADGGTIFLDEIGDVPLDVQVKLLRVLQEQEFERVGGTETRRVNVRLIAATNRDLTQAVKEKAFRADLFYRLNVFPLQVPPLRQRKDDIPLLAHYLIDKFAGQIGKPIREIDSDSMQRLVAYDWPGNIRELSNIIERAVILSGASKIRIEKEAFQFTVSEPNGDEPHLFTIEDIERSHILKILSQTNWVINGDSGAAQILGLHPNTLRNRMQKLGIQRSGHHIS